MRYFPPHLYSFLTATSHCTSRWVSRKIQTKPLPSVSIPAPDPDQFATPLWIRSATRCDCSDYYARRDGREKRARAKVTDGGNIRNREGKGNAKDTSSWSAGSVRDRELGERTSGIKPFFRYVTPWPDRERSFFEGGGQTTVSAGRSTYFPRDDVLASLPDYDKFPRRRCSPILNKTPRSEFYI